jgi:exopolysaccharide biosynthesis polyprenyl glycosylphosphotransferase
VEGRTAQRRSRSSRGRLWAADALRGASRLLSGSHPVSDRETAWNDPLRRRMLAAADLMSALLTISVVVLAGVDNIAGLACAAVIVPLWLGVAKAFGLYDLDHARIRHLTVEELPQLFHAATMVSAATALLFALVHSAELPPQAAVAMWLSLLLFTVVFRAGARSVWRRLVPPERSLMIGDGDVAHGIERKLALEPGHHLKVVRSVPADELAGSSPHTAGQDLLTAVIDNDRIDRVIVALPELDEPTLYRILALCRTHRLKLSVTPPIRAMLGTAVSLNHLAELPVIEFKTWDPSRSTMFLKRTFDLAVAVPALILLLPVMGILALIVRLDSPGAPFFVQTRAGRTGRPFRIFKFRTMVNNAEARLGEVVDISELPEPMYKHRADPRVTRVGRLLRRTSLDELPQLVNVVKGEMSLVGPRPEAVDLVERYSEAELFRLDMRPGMTGPMQVHGRGELSFQERLAVEREYIENYSLGKDVDILFRTATAVVRGHGAF